MSRRIGCIAMTLALSALITVSVEAAPTTRTPRRESVPEERLFAEAREWLASWLRGSTPWLPSGVKGKLADDTSHLDPNGVH
jgi:hypothetical protein